MGLVKALHKEMISDHLGRPNTITSVLTRGRQEGEHARSQCDNGSREKAENAKLLTLMMEERTMSQRRQVVSRS